jgi:hypothetical protein
VGCRGTAIAAAAAVEAEHAVRPPVVKREAWGIWLKVTEGGVRGCLVLCNGRGSPGVFGALARGYEASTILVRKNMLTRLICTNYVK